VGLIGSAESVHLAQRFIKSCSAEVSNKGQDPILFPDFPGLRHTLNCEVELCDSWTQIMSEREIDSATEPESFNEKLERTTNLFLEKVRLGLVSSCFQLLERSLSKILIFHDQSLIVALALSLSDFAPARQV